MEKAISLYHTLGMEERREVIINPRIVLVEAVRVLALVRTCIHPLLLGSAPKTPQSKKHLLYLNLTIVQLVTIWATRIFPL